MCRWCLVVLLLALASEAQEIALCRVGDVWKFRDGLSAMLGHEQDWPTPGYDDSSWSAGPSGFSAGFVPSEATVLPQSLGQLPASFCFRRSWELPDTAYIKWLTLRVDYTDGFVAYLNGTEIARRNLSGAPQTLVPYDALATDFHDRGEVESIDLTPWCKLLVPGTNTLAVQVHRWESDGVDLCFSAELMANFTRAPYIQNTSSNRFQVVWKTPVASTTRVDFGPSTALGTTVEDTNLVQTHVATLSPLAADSSYFYQVSSSDAFGNLVPSPLQSSRTSRTSGPVSFVVFGDGGWNSPAQYALAGVIEQAAPDFVLEVGDLVYPSFTAALTDPRCFSPYQGHMATTPYYYLLGNHDVDYGGATNYLDAFYLPTNSVPLQAHALAGTSPKHYYSFDQGDAHIVALYQPYLSQYQLTVGDAQYSWLTNDLARTQKPWKIVCWHVPMNSSSQHRYDDVNFNGIYDRLEIRDVLLPVLSRYGVQLALCGHEHGYERFNPTNGVHFITTAGGGVPLYGFTDLDDASAYYGVRFNCVKVTIEGDQLQAQALGTAGEVFDSMTIQRRLPRPEVYRAAWHSPLGIGAQAPGTSTPSFDFVGEAIPAVAGQFSNLGRVYVNNDQTNLYIGLQEVIIYGSDNVFLFVESPRAPGVPDLLQVGNGFVDPNGQGADGLDCLSNLAFQEFNPSVGCILGDPLAHEQSRNLARTNLSLNIGQGVFQLDAKLSDVANAPFLQFNPAPPMGRFQGEPNASVIEVAIPFAQLGGVQPGESIRLGAIVGGAEYDIGTQSRSLDSGFLGQSFVSAGLGPALLEGLQVQLALDPTLDQDGDGLPDAWEVAHGLNPRSSTGVDGPDGDPDGDGATNLEEYLAGTDPKKPDSVLWLRVQSLDRARVRLSWLAIPGHTYEIQGFDPSVRLFKTIAQMRRLDSESAGDLSYEVDSTSDGDSWHLFRIKLGP